MVRMVGPRRTHLAIATLALSVTAGASAVAVTSGSGHPRLGPAVDPAGSPHAAAITEVRALLAAAPTLGSASRAASAPTKILRQPPTELADGALVWRARYWTTDQGWNAAFDQLTATAPTGLRSTGVGSAGGPSVGDDVRYATYQSAHPPRQVAWAELVVATAPRGSGSGIAVYGEAVPQPPKPRTEHIPAGTHHVVVERRKGVAEHVVRRVRLGPNKAATLVHDFDAMKVGAGGVRSCPADVVGSPRQRVRFRAHGHTWRADDGTCGLVQVRRDGRSLPALDETGKFARDLRRDLAAHGRPAAEHVPLSVRHVVVERQSIHAASERHVLGRDRRRHLAQLFDGLKVWPPDRVQCEIATTTQQVVKFRTHHHTWLTRVGAACRGMTVSRDGHGLPMLVPTTTWESAVNRILND